MSNIAGHLLKFLQKSSIRKRIFVYFFSFVVLFQTFTYIFIFLLVFSRFKSSEENHAINKTNEAKQSIEFLLNLTHNTASLLASDNHLVDALNHSKLRSSEEAQTLKQNLDNLLINTISVNDYIDNIHIVGSEGEFFSSYWDTDRATILRRYGGEEALRRLLAGSGEGVLISYREPQNNQNALSFIRKVQLYQEEMTLGVIIVDLNYTYLREVFNYSTLKFNNEMILVANSRGEPLFSFPFNSSLTPILEEYPVLVKENTLMTGKVFNRQCYLISSSILYSDWTMIRVIFHDEIFKGFKSIRLLSLIMGAGLLILALFGSYILSISITQPIIDLKDRISQFQKGNLKVQVEGSGDDEIGQLQSTFNTMVHRINDLMNDTLEEQKKKSEMKFKVLQTQINPHFLYNTLDSVKWLAVFYNNSKIADLVASLINLLKYNISREDNLVTLNDEICVLEDYVKLQKYRFGEAFSVEYEIQPDSGNCYIIRFLLQPLIENAIFHGFQDMDDEGLIVIKSFIHESSLVLTISDNGQGLKEYPDITEEKDSLKSKRMNTGIGVNNVKDRISLYFDGQGDFSIMNNPEGGVVVTITLPVIHENDLGTYDKMY